VAQLVEAATRTGDRPEAATGDEPPRPHRPALGWLGFGAFALLAYVPLFVTARGKVMADTKAYLYLDPGRLLARAGTIWDPSISMGTLSHQQIGYLFPMGPYFWAMDRVGVPTWIAQRLWLGTFVLLAGAGVWFLLRTLGVRGFAVGVAVLAYAFTPYVLGYSGIASMLLGPWVALPWWIAMAQRALHRDGWVYPALFALSVQLVGSLNGSALFFGLVGPALWVLYAVLVAREARWGKVWSVGWRTGLLTFLTSLWWLGPLWVEGRYGLNILRFTESVQTVSTVSYPYEVLRGLGYWFLYGGDRVHRWTSGIGYYTTRIPIVVASIAIPTAAFLAAASLRWRYRAFFIVLVLVGVAISVGATPYDDPSIAGSAYKEFALSSDVGFALRNTARAVPLVALGLAVLLAVGIAALTRWLDRRRLGFLGLGVAVLVAILVLVNALPALTGHYYQDYLARDSEVPGYWQQAIKDLDARPHDTRVLGLPGADFASYRWGDTRDTIEPGLMDRPFVARELVPWGSAATANLVQALDHRVQNLTIDPDAIAPVARFMGAGDVEVRLDLQTDKWGLAPAEELWRLLTRAPIDGLDGPKTYGRRIPGKLKDRPLVGVYQPRAAGSAGAVPPVAVFAVQDPVSIVRATAGPPTVVAGDGNGIVDAAGAGVLDGRETVVYSGTYAGDPDELRDLPRSTPLVVTDSNRRRGLRWTGLSGNFGYTEVAGEEPLADDPIDQRLDLFPDADDRAHTVTRLQGVESVQATTYGTPGLPYSPNFRPSQAFDGDLKTSWGVHNGTPVDRQRIEVVLDEPITTDHVGIVQLGALKLPGVAIGRSITSIKLRFDDEQEVVRSLGRPSRTRNGETVSFPRRTFRKLSIEILDTKGAEGNAVANKNAVGFTEIDLADEATPDEPVRIVESTRLPTDLLGTLGAASQAHPLTVVLTSEPTMDRPALRREVELPTDREFTVAGRVTLSGNAKDGAVSRALGIPDASAGGITVRATDHLADARARASSALDGDPTTAWVTPVADLEQTITVTFPEPITVDHLDLQVVADGQHSLPTRLTIESDDGSQRSVAVPAVPVRAGGPGIADAPVQFPALTGRTFRISIDDFRRVRRTGVNLPIGFAELGFGPDRVVRTPAQLPTACLTDLVTVDGAPLPVRIAGSTADALAGQRLPIVPCDDAALVLSAGTHHIETAVSPHNPTGFDVAQLTLQSDAGGAAPTAVEPQPAPEEPSVEVVEEGRASSTVRVTGATEPFWLVMGQSVNPGWTASVGGKDLGESTLVDGYANGWRIRPSDSGEPVVVKLAWEPQQTVWRMILVSLAAVLVCLGILAVAVVRRRGRAAADAAGVPTVDVPEISPAPPASGLGTGATVGAILAAGAIGALLVRPWVGALVAVVTYLAIRWAPWRLVLRLAPFAIAVGMLLTIAVRQGMRHYPARFDWPTHFEAALLVPAWLAVVLLAADAIIECTVRARRRRDVAPRAPEQ
jgi:arabinofuranan 3-O-arabinosyltransferase